MPLATYKPPTFTIKLGPNNSFQVRGLTGSHFSMLIESNLDAFEVIFGVFDEAMKSADNPDKLTSDNIQSWLVQVIKNVPRLAPSVIAFATDEDSSFEDKLNGAMSLPMPLQIEAIMEIARLTFDEVGGVKKFISQIRSLVPAKIAGKKTTLAKALSSGSTTAPDAT